MAEDWRAAAYRGMVQACAEETAVLFRGHQRPGALGKLSADIIRSEIVTRHVMARRFYRREVFEILKKVLFDAAAHSADFLRCEGQRWGSRRADCWADNKERVKVYRREGGGALCLRLVISVRDACPDRAAQLHIGYATQPSSVAAPSASAAETPEVPASWPDVHSDYGLESAAVFELVESLCFSLNADFDAVFRAAHARILHEAGRILADGELRGLTLLCSEGYDAARRKGYMQYDVQYRNGNVVLAQKLYVGANCLGIMEDHNIEDMDNARVFYVENDTDRERVDGNYRVAYVFTQQSIDNALVPAVLETIGHMCTLSPTSPTDSPFSDASEASAADDDDDDVEM